MQSKKHVYFFVNDFGLTGSETLLCGFINDLSLDDRYSLHLVTKNPQGQLIGSLPKNIKVHYFTPQYSFWEKVKAFARFDVIGQKLEKLFGSELPSIIYLNTLSNAYLLSHLQYYSSVKILHIHEYLMGLNSLNPLDFNHLLNSTDVLVTCSERVTQLYSDIYKKELIQINSVQRYPIINFSEKPKNNKSNKIRIACAGTVCYFKGFDYFLEMASYLDPTKYELVWFGQFDKSAFSEWAKLKLEQSSFAHVRILTFSDTKDYLSELHKMDVFVFTSREESMGLVLMDAIYCGLPIICLEKIGSSLVLNRAIDKFIQVDELQDIEAHILNSVKNSKLVSSANRIKFNYEEEYAKFKLLVDKY